MMKTNALYYGDNLSILRDHIPDQSVDLIYLDPPFNSQANYNVLFKEPTGEQSVAQVQAFTDTWHWDEAASNTYAEIQAIAPDKVARAVEALRQLVGRNDVMAYLVMMTARLLELHRVLKPTGSLYLHCDPTASHYLKVVLDSIFGPRNFRNEITWKRYSSHGNVYRNYGKVHDILFVYGKTGNATWNQQYRPLNQEYVEKFFRKVEPGTGRRYQLQNVLNPNKNRPNLTYDWNGHLRVWKWTRERMQQLHDEGRLEYSKTGYPRLKQYLDESLGEKLQDIWDDIRPIGQTKDDISQGFETQKPLALLERIINASSNEGDVVLDPFCGCGTAVVAAQKLNRRWIGIDVTHLAITVMKRRLEDGFPGIQYEVIGEPTDMAGARALAEQDRYQFQWWALGLVGAMPAGDRRKKGADQGIDGIIAVHTDRKGGVLRAVVQVKSGHVSARDIRDLKGVVGEGIGLFVTLEPPTQPMITEAAQADLFHSPLMERYYPRIQILTIEELLNGAKTPQIPPRVVGPRAPLIGQAVQQGSLT